LAVGLCASGSFNAKTLRKKDYLRKGFLRERGLYLIRWPLLL
jgi:hypothetical protein